MELVELREALAAGYPVVLERWVKRSGLSFGQHLPREIEGLRREYADQAIRDRVLWHWWQSGQAVTAEPQGQHSRGVMPQPPSPIFDTGANK